MNVPGRACLVALLVCLPSLADGGDRPPHPSKSDSRVKVTASATKPDTERKQTITLQLDIKDGCYIFANPVGNEEFKYVYTLVRIRGEKVQPTAVEVRYPSGEDYKVEGLPNFKIYKGRVTIPVIVQRAPDNSDPLEVTIHVQASGSAPRDQCLLPGTIKLKLP